MFTSEFRKNQGLTQNELASMLGVKRSCVAKWETGKTFPGRDVLIKLSEIFHCTIDELVKGEACEKKL